MLDRYHGPQAGSHTSAGTNKNKQTNKQHLVNGIPGWARRIYCGLEGQLTDGKVECMKLKGRLRGSRAPRALIKLIKQSSNVVSGHCQATRICNPHFPTSAIGPNALISVELFIGKSKEK